MNNCLSDERSISPSVTLINFRCGKISIVVTSPYTQGPYHTFVFWIDRIYGFPCFSGIPGHDLFPDHKTAISTLGSKYDIKNTYKGLFLIGIINVGNKSLISLITKAKEIGLINGKHKVYKVTEIKQIKSGLMYLENCNNFELDIKNIGSFPVINNHFFCPSLEITGGIGKKIDESMIWNLNQSNQFETLIKGICVKLIQGTFDAKKLDDRNILLLITRRRCIGSENVQGLNINGNVGNESEVEIVLETKRDDKFETFSHTFLRMTTPSSPNIDMALGNAPLLYHRITAKYEVTEASLIDFNHTEEDNAESKVLKNLKDIIKFIKGVFNVNLQMFDWDCTLKNGIDFTVKAFLQTISPNLEKYGITNIIWNNENKSVVRKQEGLFIFSCSTGIDRSNSGSFYFALFCIAKILSFSSLHEQFSSNLNDLKNNTKINSFIGNSFLKSADIISKCYIKTKSIKENDILMFFENQKLIPNEKITNIIQKRKGILANYDEIKKNVELFCCFKEILTSPKYSIKSNRYCLSMMPGASLLSPSHLDPMIFGYQNTSTFLNVNEDYITISLSQPARISEILFRKFPYESNNSYPSSVSVFGGMYLNRMYPIIKDLLLPQTENTFKCIRVSFPEQQTYVYNTKINFNNYEPIRYLKFDFKSMSDIVTIQNIFVYGKNVEPENLNIHLNEKINIDSKLEFLEEPSFANILRWEEKRLYLSFRFQDFVNYMIYNRSINPYLASVSYLCTLKNNLPITPKCKCSYCQKMNATFTCGMCEKPFCEECNHKNECNETLDDQTIIKSIICDECFINRKTITKQIPKFEILKKRMALNLYPFLGKSNSIAKLKSYQNNEQYIGSQFIYSLANGENNINAEFVLDKNNTKEWKPKDTYISLSVLLRQPSNITSILIKTSNVVFLEIDDSSSQLKFNPPISSNSINFKGQIINIRLIGNPICIKNILFIGESLSVEVPKYSPFSKQIDYSNKYVNSTNRYDHESYCLNITLQSEKYVIGLNFSKIQFFSSFALEYIIFGVKKCLYFNVPECDSVSNVFFNEYIRISSFKLWFIGVSSNFECPLVQPISLNSISFEEQISSLKLKQCD